MISVFVLLADMLVFDKRIAASLKAFYKGNTAESEIYYRCYFMIVMH